MSKRIREMRVALVDELKKAGSTLDWSHVTTQIGMFSYTVINCFLLFKYYLGTFQSVSLEMH